MAGKNALNRSSYVEAALKVIAEVGVDKLSMRAVATQLNVSPMAVYKHFPAKEYLLSAALEEFIARADVVPDTSLRWDIWVEQVARGMYGALCRELSWVPLLGSLRMGAQAAAVTDTFVKKLCTAGFTTEQAVRAYFAIVQLVVGAVCLRSSLDSRQDAASNTDGELSSVTRDYLGKLDSDRLRIAPVLESILSDDQIEIALPLLIEALKIQRLAGKPEAM
jgi:TetR/AcrR family tetracycline transcriptional repressor